MNSALSLSYGEPTLCGRAERRFIQSRRLSRWSCESNCCSSARSFSAEAVEKPRSGGLDGWAKAGVAGRARRGGVERGADLLPERALLLGGSRREAEERRIGWLGEGERGGEGEEEGEDATHG